MAREEVDIELGLRSGSAGLVNGHDDARLGRNSPPIVVRIHKIAPRFTDPG
jgi:hypothetical protein